MFYQDRRETSEKLVIVDLMVDLYDLSLLST